MSYEMDELREYRLGVIETGDTREIEFGVTAADSKTFVFAVKVSAITGTGGTMAMFTSLDGGATWQTVTNTIAEAISAAGVFRIYPTATSSPVMPLVKVVITPDAVSTVTLAGLYRTKVAPGDSTFPSAAAGSTASIIGPLGQQLAAASVSVVTASDKGIRAVDPAGGHPEVLAETTGELRIASMVPEKFLAVTNTPTATEDVFKYYSDAGATVLICTVTVTYTDATKEVLVSAVRT